MKHTYLFAILVLGLFPAFSQHNNATTKRAITEPSGEARFSTIRKLPESFVYQSSFTYHWFDDHIIQATQGGASGEALHGAYEYYYPDRRLKTQGLFYFGLKDGLWKYWNTKGFLLRIENYKKGILHGLYEIRSETGMLLSTGFYHKGLRKGIWSEFDTTGKLINNYRWKKGIREGKFTDYSSGKCIKGNYHHNLIDGKLYFLNGDKIDSVKTYKKGVEQIKTNLKPNKIEKQTIVKQEPSKEQKKKTQKSSKTTQKPNKKEEKKNPDTTQTKIPFWKRWFSTKKHTSDSLKR